MLFCKEKSTFTAPAVRTINQENSHLREDQALCRDGKKKLPYLLPKKSTERVGDHHDENLGFVGDSGSFGSSTETPSWTKQATWARFTHRRRRTWSNIFRLGWRRDKIRLMGRNSRSDEENGWCITSERRRIGTPSQGSGPGNKKSRRIGDRDAMNNWMNMDVIAWSTTMKKYVLDKAWTCGVFAATRINLFPAAWNLY